MSKLGTSTIVQYERAGDIVVAHFVLREWRGSTLVEIARWLVPGGIGALKREATYGTPPGPLGYGRADLIAGGVIKPALHTFDSHPYLALKP